MQFSVFTRSRNIVSKYRVKLIRAMFINLIAICREEVTKVFACFYAITFICQVELKFANIGS